MDDEATEGREVGEGLDACGLGVDQVEGAGVAGLGVGPGGLIGKTIEVYPDLGEPAGGEVDVVPVSDPCVQLVVHFDGLGFSGQVGEGDVRVLVGHEVFDGCFCV